MLLPVGAAACRKLLAPDGIVVLIHDVIGDQRRGGGEVAFRVVVEGIRPAVGAGGEPRFQIERDGRAMERL
ncbi:hypothetical protein UA44_24180, partial [Klebsiella aerogenes]